MATQNTYSEAQIKDLVNVRDKGIPWSEITSLMNANYSLDLTAEGYRSLYRRAKKAKPKKPKAEQPKRQILLPKFEDLQRTVETRNDRILFISDMHIPYQHPDTFEFLAALKKKYKPTRVVCVGDEVDKHAMSFHDSDPDLASAGDELNKAIEILQPLYKMFPNVDLVDSNHGSMHFRKGKHHGIPRKYLRDYGEILDAPKGWVWSHDLTIMLPDGNECYVHHGLSKNAIKVVQQRGTCFIQGHHHSNCDIQYAGNPQSLLWGMTVGCSIDKNSLAFAYDRNNLGRPIISHAMVIDSHPRLMPMVLDGNGRWTKVVP